MWKLKQGNMYRVNQKIINIQQSDYENFDAFVYNDLPVFVEFSELRRNFAKHTKISIEQITLQGVKTSTKTKNKKPNMFHIICEGDFFEVTDEELIFIDYYDFNMLSGNNEFDNIDEMNDLPTQHGNFVKHEPLLLFLIPKTAMYVFMVTNDVMTHWENKLHTLFFEEYLN
jgi:hypothetical protein